MVIQSTVPGVITALRTLFAAVLPAGFPALFIGPPPGGDVPDRYVCVAYGGDDRPGVIGTARRPEYGNTGDVGSEAYGVWCAVSTASGDQDAAAQMAVTDGYFQTCVAAVRANPKLGGVLQAMGSADLGPFEWSIEDGGNIATVFFQVVVDAGWVS